jgi:integrase
MALFVNDLFPFIGARRLDSLTGPEVLRTVRRIEARGAVETAYRALKAAGAVFRHGVQNGYCDSDPTRDLKGAIVLPESKHRAAITDPAKLGELLRAIDAYSGTPVVRAALALAPLVFLRPNELRRAEWGEFDLDAAMWTIPSIRMKGRLRAKLSGTPHIVPLAPQAVAILRELQPITGEGRYVFPGPLTAERPMSDNAILTALRRMGFPKEEVTGHGFRATARTLLAERLDIQPEVIEAQLAHAVGDALGRAYNRTKFLEQRRRMMVAWANYLYALRDGPASGKGGTERLKAFRRADTDFRQDKDAFMNTDARPQGFDPMEGTLYDVERFGEAAARRSTSKKAKARTVVSPVRVPRRR